MVIPYNLQEILELMVEKGKYFFFSFLFCILKNHFSILIIYYLFFQNEVRILNVFPMK